MPKADHKPSMSQSAPTTAPVEVYSGTARGFHWLTVALIAIQLPIGVYMVYRGSTLNIWDGLTNNLYSSHKLIGFVLLWLVLARLAYRLSAGAPADEPTLEPWQKAVSHTVHWVIYALLIALPIGGWIGVSAYPATNIFGLFNLPSIWTPDKAFAETILAYHGIAGLVLAGLIGMHVGAALFHHFVRKDNVLRRMIGRPR
jgi:cytochrome b561